MNITHIDVEWNQRKAKTTCYTKNTHLHEVVKNIFLVRTRGEPQRQLSIVTAAVRQTRDLGILRGGK